MFASSLRVTGFRAVILATALAIAGIANVKQVHAQLVQAPQGGGSLLQGVGHAVQGAGQRTQQKLKEAELQALSDIASQATADYAVAGGCGGNQAEVEKKKTAADDANHRLDRAIIDYLERYSKALFQAHLNIFYARRNAVGLGEKPSESPAVQKAEQELDETRRSEINRIKDLLLREKPISYRAVGECPAFTISVELGGGSSRNGFEDYNFNSSGIIGGVSGRFSFPMGAGVYSGVSVSVLGSGISGTTSDPITSNIQALVPVDALLGVTFAPSGFRWPVSIYGFGGLAIGWVNINAPPFSVTQSMTGWSAGIGGDLQLSPTWSVGLKYRHFDLGSANFSVFPGGTSLVTERGDMVTATLSYRLPSLLSAAPAPPLLTK
jgi:opacity protein-like surface antigen